MGLRAKAFRRKPVRPSNGVHRHSDKRIVERQIPTAGRRTKSLNIRRRCIGQAMRLWGNLHSMQMPKGATMTTHVTETAAAPPELAVRHFEEMLAFETDCWDVHESLKSVNPDFIVVDVRGPSAFANGHVEGAINVPHREMTAARMA